MRQWEIQRAIYSRLTSRPAVTVFVEDRIYDDVPQGVKFPYIVIGEASSSDWSQDCSTGEDTDVVIHVWDRPESSGGPQGYARTKQILAAIYVALNRDQMQIDDAHCVDIQFAFQDTFLDPDGITRHGVIRFRLLTTHY